MQIFGAIYLYTTWAIITAALEGRLENAIFDIHPVFGSLILTGCDGVPSEILNPRNRWSDKPLYDKKAKDLARLFVANFEKYASGVSEAILAAAPIV